MNSSYNRKSKKEYDFITIRNMLDGSKYCIDIVNRLAKENPQFKFLVIGKGEFFNYNSFPKNLKYELRNLTHNEIIEYLNNAKCALMLTRADAQGVMMCEMATFGIPVITSDIYVCREMLGNLENVRLIDNDSKVELSKLLEDFSEIEYKKSEKFSYDNTIMKEIILFKKVVNEYEKNNKYSCKNTTSQELEKVMGED